MKSQVINCETGEINEVDVDQHEAEQTAIAQAWRILREHRNTLLAASDWTVLTDTPTTTAAWKAYRQQLRDLPANTSDPRNVVWPTPPA